MSANRLIFEGLDELRAALRNLPTHLAAEASRPVQGAANAAAASIKAGYPVRTGKLRDHLIVETIDAPFQAGALVKNTARHAAIFEYGTQARHTAIGANRGSMPPGHVFIPAIVRARRRMYEDLKGLLERNGLQVSGDAE
jgi:Bacteriophage HK97-gp10, putative tail-component